MAATFSRLKNWNAETLTNEDLNNEIDNILDNLGPAGMDGSSSSVGAMQITADPGEVGSESLATTLEGELHRLRFMLGEITGKTEWYESPGASIAGLITAVGTGLKNNRLVSGRSRTDSAQPLFLVPNGAAATVTVDGDPINFVYYVESTQYTISTDVNLTGLTAAPGSNNTCLINDANAADDEYTMYTGENGTTIPVDNMGSEISSLVGSYAAFSLAGSATEYFIAYVKSTTELTQVRRGFFFDSSDAPVPRAAYTNNDTITLLNLSWIFARTDGTLTVTYTNPTWADDEPSSPSSNDYWYDYGEDKWKRYDISSFVDAAATLVGICAQDTSNCIAARSFDFANNFRDFNSVEVRYESATQLTSARPDSSCSVYGVAIDKRYGEHIWDITVDLESGVSEAAGTTFYVYLTETGDVRLSDKRPYDRRGDLQGWYHPHHSWRCVGSILNDFDQNFDEATLVSIYRKENEQNLLRMPEPANFNYVDNAQFLIWQAQVPGTLTSRQDDEYSADQWYILTSGGATNVNCARVAETITGSATRFVGQFRQADATDRQYGVAQIIEFVRCLPLRGKEVSFGFYARTDSAEVADLRAGIVEWSGTADNVTSDIVQTWAATPALIANADFVNTPKNLPLDTSWRYFSFKAELSHDFNNLIFFIWTPAAEAQNNDFYLSQVQCVQGSKLFPFSAVARSRTEEVARLRFFYETSYAGEDPPATSGSNGYSITATGPTASHNFVTTNFQVEKRSTPTISYFDLAGNASRVTQFSAGAAAQSNNQNYATTFDVGTRSFVRDTTQVSGSEQATAIHWVADSRL